MKKFLAILKIAGAGAAGAVVANPDWISSVVPPKYQPLAGAAVAIAALVIKSPEITKPATEAK